MGLLDRFRRKDEPRVEMRVIEYDAPPERPRPEIIDRRDESKLPENALLLGGQGRVEVRGENNYQEALDRICGGKCEVGHSRKVIAILQPEPENPYDTNAVAIRVDGELVGYMAKESAADYAPIAKILSDAGKVGAARAFIRGGWQRGAGDEGHYGIELELSSIEVLLKSRKIKALVK